MHQEERVIFPCKPEISPPTGSGHVLVEWIPKRFSHRRQLTVRPLRACWQPQQRAGSDRAWVIAVEETRRHSYARSFGSAGSSSSTIRHVRACVVSQLRQHSGSRGALPSSVDCWSPKPSPLLQNWPDLKVVFAFNLQSAFEDETRLVALQVRIATLYIGVRLRELISNVLVSCQPCTWYVTSQRHTTPVTVHFAPACWSVREIVHAGNLDILVLSMDRTSSFHLAFPCLRRAARSWTICDCRRSPNWKMSPLPPQPQHRSRMRCRSRDGSTRSRWRATPLQSNSETNSNDLNGKTRFLLPCLFERNGFCLAIHCHLHFRNLFLCRILRLFELK